MERNPLLPLPEGMQIEQMQESPKEVKVVVIAMHPTSCCPLCRQPSCSIHSRYQRTVRDVPCGGRRIQLLLTVRKFFCCNPLCERKFFTERLPDLVHSWTRMTIRLCEQLTSIGLATCGKGGTRKAGPPGHANDSLHHPAAHHGTARPLIPVGGVSGSGRFCISAWFLLWNSPGRLR